MSVRNLIIALAVVAVIALLAMKGCTSQRQVAEQAKHDNRVARAHVEAAADAANTIEKQTGDHAELREVVAVAAKEIASAEGSDQKITPAVRSAALAAACRLPDYRNEPACRVQ